MSTTTNIRAQDLTFGSLFKVIFTASLVFWAIFGLAVSVAALFGLQTVNWNGNPVTGVPGFFIGMLISLFVGGLFGAIGSVGLALVIKLLGRILPIGPLRTVAVPNATVTATDPATP